MKPNTTCAGECMYENFKLEYQVVYLEFIRKKSLKIETICINPNNTLDKEVVLKYSTNNLSTPDEQLKIAYSIMDSVIQNLNLSRDKLFKLIVKNHQIFYVYKI